MERRLFIKNLCEALPVLAVVPVVLSKVVKPKTKQVIVFEVPVGSGNKYWLDWEEYQTMLKLDKELMERANQEFWNATVE